MRNLATKAFVDTFIFLKRKEILSNDTQRKTSKNIGPKDVENRHSPSRASKLHKQANQPYCKEGTKVLA